MGGRVGNPPCASSSGEHESVGELELIKHWGRSNLPDELMNEPIPVLLKYTFSLDSVLLKNSIQAGFGGLRLKSAIKDLHEVITNGSNVVAVQKHFRLIGFRVKGNFSVTTLPIAGVTNGGVHLAFDLTHWCQLREQR